MTIQYNYHLTDNFFSGREHKYVNPQHKRLKIMVPSLLLLIFINLFLYLIIDACHFSGWPLYPNNVTQSNISLT